MTDDIIYKLCLAFLLATILGLTKSIKSFKAKIKEDSDKYQDLWIKFSTTVTKAQDIEMEVLKHYENIFQGWCAKKEKEIRKDALDRSRSIMRGQATEHLAPYMLANYSAKDFRFMGNPIDYIIFDGLSSLSDGEQDHVDKVILLDIKTGNSKLSKVQRRIRDCIARGDVEFLTFNPDKDNEETLEPILHGDSIQDS